MPSPDHYATLGVSRDADVRVIKKAYRALALQWHPDKNPNRKAEAEAKFKDINEAFGVLSDSSKRAAYDRGSEEYDDEQGHHHGSFWDEGVPPRTSRNNGPHAGAHHFTRANAFDIFNAFFGGNPFGGHGRMHQQQQQQQHDPFGMMNGMGMGMFGSPFGAFGMMNGGGGRSQHMRAQTDPFASMLGGMGMGGGFSSMMSSGFGGGFGGSSVSTSSSTSYDRAGRMVTQTTRTTVENGQSKSVTTTEVHHPDGRVETSQSHSINGQLQQPQQQPALPSARTPSASPPSGRSVPISSGPPRQAAPAPAPSRSPPIDLRSSSSDSDDEVEEIPAPIRRPHQHATPPSAHHTHNATSIPADRFSQMNVSQSQSQTQTQSRPPIYAQPHGQPHAQPHAQPRAQASPSFTPATYSPPMHQRSATHSFGSTGYSPEHHAAMRRDQHRAQQQQQQQREIDARIEQSRLATQQAQRELDAHRASMARMREEASTAPAGAQHRPHQRSTSGSSQPPSFGRSNSATAAGSPVAPAAGTASPISGAASTHAHASPPVPPHVRTASGGHPHTPAAKAPSPTKGPVTGAAPAVDPRAWYPPPPISSVPRGVSAELLNRRADRTFDECFSEHADDHRRRTKL